MQQRKIKNNKIKLEREKIRKGKKGENYRVKEIKPTQKSRY